MSYRIPDLIDPRSKPLVNSSNVSLGSGLRQKKRHEYRNKHQIVKSITHVGICSYGMIQNEDGIDINKTQEK